MILIERHLNLIWVAVEEAVGHSRGIMCPCIAITKGRHLVMIMVMMMMMVVVIRRVIATTLMLMMAAHTMKCGLK